ncbi:MAG: PEP-CTERM sorting domain-containing protein [Rubrivivax sp.]|nr:PEP-CTERM sorting domain-containing protein [Rubrivivax sp.]
MKSARTPAKLQLSRAARRCWVGLAGLAVTGLASASLVGQTVHVSSFANLAGIDVVVGAGVEYDFTSANGQRDVIDIDADGFTVTIYHPVGFSWFYAGAGGGDLVVLSGIDELISSVAFLTPAATANITASNLQFSNGSGLGDGSVSFEMSGGPQAQNPMSWTVGITTVPEPGALALVGIALAGLGLSSRRKV